MGDYVNMGSAKGANVTMSSGKGTQGQKDGDIILDSGNGSVIVNGQKISGPNHGPYLNESDRLAITFIYEEARKKVYAVRRTLEIWLAANRERIERIGAIQNALRLKEKELENTPMARLANIVGIRSHSSLISPGWGSGNDSSFALFGYEAAPESLGKPTFFKGCNPVESSEDFVIAWLEGNNTEAMLLDRLESDLKAYEDLWEKATA